MGYARFTFPESSPEQAALAGDGRAMLTLRQQVCRMDPEWYAAWRAEAFQDLVKKNERLETEFKIGGWPRYDYDMVAGILRFSDQGVNKVVAEMQVAGTTRLDDWQWAWSNENFPAAAIADAALVEAFGRKHGIEILMNAHTRAEDAEGLGWELAAVMVRVTNALGVYRAPSRGGGFLFVTLKSVAWAS
jgi:hypothetical protein